MSRRQPIRTLGVACALVMVLGACGSSKKTASSSTTTTAAAKSGTTTTGAAATSGDKAKADAINLVAADFPSGWTSTPADNSSSSDNSDKQLYACAGLTDRAAEGGVDVSSPDFSKGEFDSAGSEVQFVKSESEAQADLAVVKSDKFPTCLKQTFDQEMTKEAGSAGGTIGASSVTTLPAPSGTDGAAAFRMTVPISAVGQNLTFYIDFVLLLQKRAEVTVSLFSGTTPFDQSLEDTLTGKLVQRMKANA